MFVDVAEVLARGEAPQIVFALKTLLADDSAVDAEPLALHLVTHAKPALRGEALHTLGRLADRGRMIDREAVALRISLGEA